MSASPREIRVNYAILLIIIVLAPDTYRIGHLTATDVVHQQGVTQPRCTSTDDEDQKGNKSSRYVRVFQAIFMIIMTSPLKLHISRTTCAHV